MKLTVIILGTDELDIGRTVNSIRDADVLSEVQVLVRPVHDPHPWSETSDGGVLLMRAGDRMCGGGAKALLRALQEADVVLAGYRIAGRGHWGLDVLPPKIDDVAGLSEWAVAPPFELSAIAMRRGVLPSSVHPAPGLPGGEVALLHAVLAFTKQVRITSMHDSVADVRIRPVHAGDPAAMLERLRGVLDGPLGDDPVIASRVRRRALSLAYLESGPPFAGQFDADTWWGPAVAGSDDVGALAVLRDLHWIMTCLAEARQITALGLDGLAKTAPTDITAEMPPDFTNMQATNESLEILVGELTDATHWLHAEIRHRDERLAVTEPLHILIADLNGTIARLHEEVRLRDAQLANRSPASESRLVDETRGIDLVRVVLRRASNRTRRVMKRGVR